MKVFIKKKRIRWVLTDKSATAFDKWQATVYTAYGCPSFQLLRREIEQSSANEYDSWADILSLAKKREVIGYGTTVRKEWREWEQKYPEGTYEIEA